MKRPNQLVWQSVEWARPFEFETVCDFMTQLNGFSRRQPFIWEIRLNKNKVDFLIGADPLDIKFLKDMMIAHHSVRFDNAKRSKVSAGYNLTLSKNHFALQTKQAENLVRTALSHSGLLRTNESIVIQLVIGKSTSPKPLPKDLPNPTTTFWQAVTGHIPKLSSDETTLLKEKLHHSQFQLSMRLGFRVESKPREIQLLKSLLSSFRLLERAGAKFSAKQISSERINHGHIPWHFQTVVSSIELASLFLLPAGDAQYTGVLSLSPKTILPPIGLTHQAQRAFGLSLENPPRFVGISAQSGLSHTWLNCGTGSGKSTVMLNLFLAEIALLW